MTELEHEIQAQFDLYDEEIRRIALREFNRVIKPYCKEHGITFYPTPHHFAKENDITFHTIPLQIKEIIFIKPIGCEHNLAYFMPFYDPSEEGK